MRYVVRFFIIITTILIIGGITSLFQNGINIDITTFFSNMKTLISLIFNPLDLTFRTTSSIHATEYPVFPQFFEYYGYSLFMLFCGLLLSLILSLLLTVLTLHLSIKKREFVLWVSNLFESLPDIFVIVIAQVTFVAIYRETGLLVFQVAGASDRPFMLPLLTYSILPTIFLFRTLIMIFEEELKRPYVELAKGKGMTRTYILLRHVFRNGVTSLVNHSKMVIAFMISNLIMLEILFNSYGMTWFVINHPTFEIATISMILLFIPIYIVECIVQQVRRRSIGEG
ncbi:ABC transporter permease subunit [Halobacillus amylolyticus]|uniref:ABC transporter permease subunit n=1 Tax=Halobacillus amylolyticus TaxID=2932259 RepID=A0ABY4H919_9BACI|nr:ABC transporter permease subunit [Halobacillus amylolyticus]UOR10962.1 ABC transporter permease subunit [Halobacillus amylolyticus]